MKEYTDYSQAYSIYSDNTTSVEPFVETLINRSPSDNGQMVENHNDIVNRRKIADTELNELYNIHNSRYQIYQSKADAATFAGILWIVLTTTLIYVVFTKL